jgi:hypothetical protein
MFYRAWASGAMDVPHADRLVIAIDGELVMLDAEGRRQFGARKGSEPC